MKKNKTRTNKMSTLMLLALGAYIPVAHADVSNLPVIPQIDDAMKTKLITIFKQGQSLGNRPNVFAKIGDSITESGSFLMDNGCAGATTFGNYSSLSSTIDYFSSVTFPSSYTAVWCGVANSFTRASLSAVAGQTTSDGLSSTSACAAPYNAQFSCEENLLKPAFALIMYGTNDLERFNDVNAFSGNLTQIVQKSISYGVIPVISTIPPRLDNAALGSRVATYNDAIASVAKVQNIPLWNYWSALQGSGMVNHGISPDGIHPNICHGGDGAIFTAECLAYGYNQRNLTALQVLQKLKSVVIDNGAADSSSGTPSVPVSTPSSTATSTSTATASSTATSTATKTATATTTSTATKTATATKTVTVTATTTATVTATATATSTSSSTSTSQPCPPEPIWIDSSGQPRNGIPNSDSGHIRQCWPNEAKCFCDPDNDCYSLDGYVACSAGSVITSTVTATATKTATSTKTATATTTSTSTVTKTATATATSTVTKTATSTSTATATGTGTGTPTSTVTATATATSTSTSTTVGSGSSPMIGNCAIYPANNPWNTDISALPVDPKSATYITNVNARSSSGKTLHPDFNNGLYGISGQANNENTYGIPYTVVNNAPLVPINIGPNGYADESDAGPMPIPSTAWIEQGGGNDRHVLVVDSGRCKAYELYHANYSGGSWTADQASIFDLKTNLLRPSGWTSADQAGLSLFAGLVRYDEVAAGVINHALRVAMDFTGNGYVLPATHVGDGNSTASAPPMGTRFRLKASFDISGYPAQAKVILTAMKKYGLMLADTGGTWFFQGMSDPRFNMNDIETLNQIPGTAFEVPQMGTIYDNSHPAP